MKRRLCALVFCLLMLLSACGSPESGVIVQTETGDASSGALSAPVTESGMPSSLGKPSGEPSTLSDTPSGPIDPTGPTDPSTVSVSTPETSSIETPSSETPDELFVPFTMGFTGDISYADTYYKKKDLHNYASIYWHAVNAGKTPESCIDDSILEEMRSVDFLVVNCESSVSDRGEPLGLKGKEYSFRTSTKLAGMFKNIGADLIGLANNHVYDFGPDAFLDTLDTFKALGIPTVGAGRNLQEAYEPYYYTNSGVTVAIIATSRAEKSYSYWTLVAEEDRPGICGCYDEALVIEKIKEAKQKADFVFVFPHYGYEGTTEIEDAQRLASYHFIDAGADLVIGGHAHRLQGIATYQGKVIFWNLGNYLFNLSSLQTALLEVHFESRDSFTLQLLPCMQTEGRVKDERGTAKGAEILQYVRRLSPGIAIDKAGNVTVAVVA